jgi:DNA-binding transcriptional MerR regulator
MTEWLSIEDLAQETGIPDRTIRRYLRQYSQYLPVKRNNRSYLLHTTGIAQLARIRDLYANGNTEEAILQKLGDTATQALTQVAEQPLEQVLVRLNHQVATAFDQFSHRQEALQVEIGAMRDELAATRRQLQAESQARADAERARERYFTQRDEHLVATIRQTMAERRKPWWQRRKRA